jgi:hypothetical protein
LSLRQIYLFMKHLLVLITALALTFQVAAQNSQQRNVGSFSGIKVSEGIDVYLKQGDKEQVRVEVSNDKFDRVITEVSGSYLKIHMASGENGHISAKVYVTYVKLNKLAASSAGNIFSETPIRAETIEIQCSSAGNIEVALQGGDVTADASSAGQIELTGKAKSLEVSSSSAAQIDAYNLDAEEVDADASSGASIKVSVRSSLNAEASSGANIRYRGSPGKSFTNSSSGGSVKKSN